MHCLPLDAMKFICLSLALASLSGTSCYLMQNTFNTKFYWHSKKFNGTLDIFYNTEKFEKNLNTRIIVHGFNDNIDTPVYKEMVQRFLEKENMNVITVDYSTYSSANSYDKVIVAVPSIGFYLGELLVRLKNSRCINFGRVHIIGHSTGAHVAAHAAKTVTKIVRGAKLGRISALNPSRPGFESVLIEDGAKLWANDARVVDVLHTDRNLGYAQSHGQADFYPNLGKLQPGCKATKEQQIYGIGKADGWKQVMLYDDYCSDSRSVLYYVESIYAKAFIATKCDSWENYESGACDGNEKIIYGDDMPSSANGTFYFRTNPRAPFAFAN